MDTYGQPGFHNEPPRRHPGRRPPEQSLDGITKCSRSQREFTADDAVWLEPVGPHGGIVDHGSGEIHVSEVGAGQVRPAQVSVIGVERLMRGLGWTRLRMVAEREATAR